MDNKNDVLSRNNHFLSQMYLAAWKKKNGKVMVHELLVPNSHFPLWKSKSTRSVGNYDSMYVRLKNGKEIDDIEKWFRDRYETPAKSALEHAINDERITPGEWHKLIDFVACHIVRSPSFIIKTLDLAKKDCTPIFEEKCEEISSITKEDYINSLNLKIKDDSNELFPIKVTDMGPSRDNNELFKVETIFGKQFYLWIMKHLLENTAKVLHTHKWGIINVDKKVILPTSDNPVICLNYNNENEYNFNGGWGRKNSNILFPISPNKILYTQIGSKLISRCNVDYKTSLLLKKIIIEHAYKKIISNFEDLSVHKTRTRVIDKNEYEREKKMWEDFQKDYLERESEFIK